jgi:hypothetical protein
VMSGICSSMRRRRDEMRKTSKSRSKATTKTGPSVMRCRPSVGEARQ